jgi:hypothetical protein
MSDENEILHEQEAPVEVQPEPEPVAEPVVNPVTDPLPDFIPEPAALSKADEAIDAWFVQHFHNLGARLEVDLFNAFHAAKEELKAILAKL